VIEAAAERASEMVRQLLIYAGKGEIERRPLDLNRLAEDSVGLLESARPGPPRVRLDLEPDLPWVSGDVSQLRQVIANLVENAREAVTGGPGGVRLVTRRAVVDERELATSVLREGFAPGPAIRLEVLDDGPGMDAMTLGRLWEPFFTTKPRGRGLGLSAVLGILRQHRATLAVESAPGTGTRFRIHLPPAGPELPAIR
jgi:signal transduction histidine kinase